MSLRDLEIFVRESLAMHRKKPRIFDDSIKKFRDLTPAEIEREINRQIAFNDMVKTGKKASEESEAAKGARIGEAFIGAHEGEVRVDHAPMRRGEVVTYFTTDEASRWEYELPTSDLHDELQRLNGGHKLTSQAFDAARWTIETDPRMNASQRQPLPRTLSTVNGVMAFDVKRILRDDEPGISAIRVNRTYIPDAPPIEETKIWKDHLVKWGQPPIHIECETGRASYPGPSGLISMNYGTGGAGMTTFAGLLELVVGAENVVHLSLDDLSPERFNRTKASLEDKLLWTADDCDPRGTMGKAHVLKELATAATLTGARLYRNPRNFNYSAHGRTHGNNPFRRDCFDLGMDDRIIETSWTARIRKTDEERVDIIRVFETMTTDLDVLFSRGVFRALERLRNGRWADEPTQRHKSLCGEILRFVECRFLWERLTHAPGQFLPWDLIEEGYRDWWPQRERHDRPAFSQGRFLRAAMLSFPGVTEDRVQVAGLRCRGCWNLAFVERENDAESCDLSELAGHHNPMGNVPSGQKSFRQTTYSFLSKGGGVEEGGEKEDSFAAPHGTICGHSEERPEGETDEAVMNQIFGSGE